MADPAPAKPFEFATRVEGGIGHIDLNRPDEGNALKREMMLGLSATLQRLGADPAVRVITVESRGPVFCRGRDTRGEVSEGLSAYDLNAKLFAPILGVYQAAAAAPVPVVACVHGAAIGFGSALAGACDLTLASDAARFSFPEIEHGIPPTLAMSGVMRSVNAKALAFLIYSGEEIDAQQAVTAGLASTVYPAASFAADTTRFLTKLASRPRIVLETIKRFQMKAPQLAPEMASDYAGMLMALMRTVR